MLIMLICVTLNNLIMLQMPRSHAALRSSSVETGGASPAGGFVMGLMTVGTEPTNCLQHAVCYH